MYLADFGKLDMYDICSSSVKICLFRSASPPQEDICQQVKDGVNGSHEGDVGPEVALVEVVAVQHLDTFGEAG